MRKKKEEINETENHELAQPKEAEKSITFNLVEVIIIILMTGLVVGVCTGLIVFKNYNKMNYYKNEFTGDYLEELEKAYNNILNAYVENVDEKALLNAAIEGMYNYLGDPYTSYLDDETSDDLTDRLNGYKGIGVEITQVEDGILVANVFKGGPADEAGILKGDIIVRINGNDVTNKTAQEAQNLIKNSKSDKVEISVYRAGITKTVDVDLKQVNVPTIESKKYDNVGYIQITSFANKTAEQFTEALESLEDEGITSLVIDLRNNGGGYLNSAVEIAELFIEKGKTIYGLESKSGTTFYSDTTKTSRKYKVGIILNSGSASASEILASALKESYGATLIGTKSYGKGTVQETDNLNSGGMIKITTAYWLTPTGEKINGKGLKPDVEISGPYKEEMTLEEDTQLKKAIETVK